MKNKAGKKEFWLQIVCPVCQRSSLKTVTGKTTPAQIAERLAAEAKDLLKHADWAISEMGYSLRFEEPAHFSKPFRKHAQVTPAAWRVREGFLWYRLQCYYEASVASHSCTFGKTIGQSMT